MNTSTTSDEKMMAALAHGSVLLMFLGPIIPTVVWASQRRNSKYVSFHALQALGYQALIFWLWMVVAILIGVLSAFLVVPFMLFMENSSHPEYGIFIFQIFIFGSMFGLIALVFLAGIIGAIYCLLGRDFRYPFFGKWLERYLSYDASSESQLDEIHEDNWVAGICHATIILRLWGIVTPLIVWFTQKERSDRLRFQSMQAFIYQGVALAAYFIGMILYLASFFGMFFILFAAGIMSGNEEIQGPAAAIMLLFFGLIVIVFWFIFLIVLPIYYLLAGVASLRVIGGHDFHYPILGNLLERRMEKSRHLEPIP